MAEATKQWVRLPIAVLQDERLTNSDATILAIIIDIVDGRTSAEISIERLMSCTGYSRRTVSYATKRLTEYGYIVSKRTGRASEYSLATEILPPKKRKESANKPEQKPKPEQPGELCKGCTHYICWGGRNNPPCFKNQAKEYPSCFMNYQEFTNFQEETQ